MREEEEGSANRAGTWMTYPAPSDVAPTHSVRMTLLVQTGFALAVVGTATNAVVVIARAEATANTRFLSDIRFLMS